MPTCTHTYPITNTYVVRTKEIDHRPVNCTLWMCFNFHYLNQYLKYFEEKMWSLSNGMRPTLCIKCKIMHTCDVCYSSPKHLSAYCIYKIQFIFIWVKLILILILQAISCSLIKRIRVWKKIYASHVCLEYMSSPCMWGLACEYFYATICSSTFNGIMHV